MNYLDIVRIIYQFTNLILLEINYKFKFEKMQDNQVQQGNIQPQCLLNLLLNQIQGLLGLANDQNIPLRCRQCHAQEEEMMVCYGCHLILCTNHWLFRVWDTDEGNCDQDNGRQGKIIGYAKSATKISL
ncbi:hypothetical protein pb186bvf_020274 [Paramecium bursaria]